MSTVIFGLYRDKETAESAASSLEQLQRTDTSLHEKPPRARDVSIAETDAAQGAQVGAVVGTLGGALAAGLTGGGAIPVALLGAGGGSIFGALAGALAGLSVPDRTLESWADEIKRGCVVLSATVNSAAEVPTVESMMLGSGALQIERADTSLPA